MKKFISALLLVAMLATCVAAMAETLKFTGSCYVYGKKGSNRTSTIIAKGSELEGTKDGSWYRISYGSGKTGYVSTKYLGTSVPK